MILSESVSDYFQHVPFWEKSLFGRIEEKKPGRMNVLYVKQ